MDLLVLVESEARVREIQPDFEKLMKIDTRGEIVTARASSADCDFVSRFSAPPPGVGWLKRHVG